MERRYITNARVVIVRVLLMCCGIILHTGILLRFFMEELSHLLESSIHNFGYGYALLSLAKRFLN